MPGPNTTGLPQTEDYNLGRGVLYFSSIDATTGLPVGGYRDLGNAPELKISVAVETLDHKSSRAGLKTIDKSVIISQDASVSFTLDEINHENLAAFLAGTESTPTNSTVAGYNNSAVVAAGNVALGRWYDLFDGSNLRSFDVDHTKLTLLGSDNSALTFGTDYTVDEEFGRFFILSTSTNAATLISGNKGIKATLAADATAHSVDTVTGLTTTPITGALKFIGQNAANSDRQVEVNFGKIQLKANGDYSLIGDTFTTLGLSGAAEKDINGKVCTINTVRTA